MWLIVWAHTEWNDELKDGQYVVVTDVIGPFASEEEAKKRQVLDWNGTVIKLTAP